MRAWLEGGTRHAQEMRSEILTAAERALNADVRTDLRRYWGGVLGVELDVLDLGRARVLRDSPAARSASVLRALGSPREAYVSWVDGPGASAGRVILQAHAVELQIHPELPALRTQVGSVTRMLSASVWIQGVCAELLGEREEELCEQITGHPPGSWTASSSLRRIEQEYSVEVSAAARGCAEVVEGLLASTATLRWTPGGLAQVMQPEAMIWVIAEGFELARAVLAHDVEAG